MEFFHQSSWLSLSSYQCQISQKLMKNITAFTVLSEKLEPHLSAKALLLYTNTKQKKGPFPALFTFNSNK